MATVFCNGRFVEAGDAKVSALDAGLQHAVGLFETMLGGVRTRTDADASAWVIDLDAHIDRLATSAAQTGLWPGLRTPALAEAVLATVLRSNLPRARVRLTVTGGDLNLAARGSAGQPAQRSAIEPTILIVAQPATSYPAQMLDEGVLVSLADARANPFNPLESHKTLNYWWRLRELQTAGIKGAAEALVFDITNHLAGGCVSNAVVIKDGLATTPAARGEEPFGADGPPPASDDPEQDATPPPMPAGMIPSCVLPGVTRARVLDWISLGASAHAGLANLRARRGPLTISDVLEADEVLLTNSSWGVLPVARVEGRQIGSGQPGPVARALRQLWERWLDSAGR
jgi:branched-subunit amino acid aminotransferase/4-amino-4-deoxychorismate lyase